jgi:hypothetical protein
LVRVEGEHALVTMCCGGGLGTGTAAAACPVNRPDRIEGLMSTARIADPV